MSETRASAGIVRIWRTRLVAGREHDYERFAREISLPMFRQQPGFLGVLFVGMGVQRAVVSFWRDAAAVDALGSSDSYRETVARISARGLLEGESVTEIWPIHGGAWPEPLR